MAFTVTSVAHARELYEKLENRMKNAKANAEARAGMFLHTAETLGTTAAFGILNNSVGKDGVLAIGHIPVDGVVGTALHLMATYGVFGKHDEHMHWVGTGALASFLYRVSSNFGAKIGPKLPGRHPQQQAPAGAGYLYPYPPAPMVGAGAEQQPYAAPYGAQAAPPPYHPGVFPGGMPGGPPAQGG
jgi:hypothetical protein